MATNVVTATGAKVVRCATLATAAAALWYVSPASSGRDNLWAVAVWVAVFLAAWLIESHFV